MKISITLLFLAGFLLFQSQRAEAAVDGITSTSYYLEKSLPVGYVKDGSRDYTRYVQQAISQNSNIVFPAFPILINDSGLLIGSNQVITFLKGSELWLKPTFKDTYHMLHMRNVSYVKLYNPVIKGDRNKHLGSTGEWGMGISVYSSNNIFISGAKVTNCWGDGIYLGQSGDEISKNITIVNCSVKNNRRDGISIISVDGLKLDRFYAGYTNGTLPMCGINFETNTPNNELRNIRVTNVKTEYNMGSGIQIGLRTMLGGDNKQVDISIANHVDTGSENTALKVSCKRKSGVNGGSISGIINVKNPTWNKTASGNPIYVFVDQPNLKTYISSARVTKNGTTLSLSATKALLNRGVTKGKCIIY